MSTYEEEIMMQQPYPMQQQMPQQQYLPQQVTPQKMSMMDYVKKHKMWIIIIILILAVLIWWFWFRKPSDDIYDTIMKKDYVGGGKTSGLNVKRSIY